MDIERWIEIFVNGFALLVMLVSLLGLLVPIFPGTVVIWVVALLYGIVSGFGTVGWIIFAILTILMIAGALADNIFMGAKAREQGASWVSIGLALGAGIVGTMVFPPVGGLIGAPVVLFLAEYYRLKDQATAWKTVKALAIGWGWSIVARFGIGVVMIILWGIWAFGS